MKNQEEVILLLENLLNSMTTKLEETEEKVGWARLA